MDDGGSSVPRAVPIAGGLAAALVVVILAAGIVSLAVGLSGLRNWLALLFAINSGADDVSFDALNVLSAIDIAVLVLTGATFVGFWPGPGRSHKVWMGLAIGLPLAGVAVLLATGLSGRSGLMGGALILSFLMLADRRFRPLGCLGIAANALLLVCDFVTSGSRAPLIAALVIFGYALLMGWFAWIAATLLSSSAAVGRT